MSNNIWNDKEEAFSDIPDEVDGNISEVPVVRNPAQLTKRAAPKPAVKTPAKPSQPQLSQEEMEEQSEEAEFANVLSDARLRLEQGRLYEMIMNHDFFADVEADARAKKHVQKEIRNFAKESMEIMLGMRQAKTQQENTQSSDFNNLEVEVLKALASTATKGVSKEAEPKRTGLTPMKSSGTVVNTPKPLQNKPAPMKRSNKNEPSEAEIQRILDEEGVSREDYEAFYRDHKPLPKAPEDLTTDELLARNKAVGAGKQVKSKKSIPMPDPARIEKHYTNQVNQASSSPVMSQILNLVEQNRLKQNKGQ